MATKRRFLVEDTYASLRRRTSKPINPSNRMHPCTQHLIDFRKNPVWVCYCDFYVYSIVSGLRSLRRGLAREQLLNIRERHESFTKGYVFGAGVFSASAPFLVIGLEQWKSIGGKLSTVHCSQRNRVPYHDTPTTEYRGPVNLLVPSLVYECK
jgi:hypothetical protein